MSTAMQKWQPAAVSLDNFRKQGANILIAPVTLEEISPWYKPRIEVVQLSTNPDDRDIYTSSFCKKGQDGEFTEAALAKNAVLKLAEIARVVPVPHLCRRTDDGRNPLYVSYDFVVAKRMPDGSVLQQLGTKEVDLRGGGSEEARLWKLAQKKLKPGGYVNGRWDKNKPPEFTNQQQAEEWVARELLAAAEHKLSNCQTKAQLRAIRSILKLKPAYKWSELERPFICLHWDLDLDYNDPDIKRMVIGAALSAQAALMGEVAQPGPPPAATYTVTEQVDDDDEEPLRQVDEQPGGGADLFSSQPASDGRFGGHTPEHWRKLLESAGSMKELSHIADLMKVAKSEFPEPVWADLIALGAARRAELESAR